MSGATITFVILFAVVLLFVWNRLPVEIVAIGAALALYATGVLKLDQILAGFGDRTVVFIATLFVIAEGLDATGVTTWIGQWLSDRTGGSRTHLLVLTMLLVAGLTALISLNGAVAALLPVVVLNAIKRDTPSQILMPVVFAAHAGSLLTITGTPVNVFIADVAARSAGGRFGFFEFAIMGVPLLAGTTAISVLFGRKLLPHRTARTIPPDLSALARTLVDQYDITDLNRLFTPERGAVEVMVPPRSALIGEPVYPGQVSDAGDFVVLAMQREGLDVTKEVPLKAGDVLLIRGKWEALHENAHRADLLVVDAPDRIRRRAAPLGPRAWIAIALMLLMVGLLVVQAMPEPVIGLVVASAMIVLRALTAAQAYRAVSWTTVILVAAMIPLSTAMRQTGAAESLATGLVNIVGNAGPYALLIGLFVLTACLGQLISNMATALIVSPIAVSAAAELGVSPRPLLMTVAVAAAAAFLTPVATPVNLMIQQPGGYRFGDYWKLGLPLLLLYFVATVVIVPLVWRF
ncbi:MAG TPA: SLC13 family permease [Vicinamibacterales bacterium]